MLNNSRTDDDMLPRGENSIQIYLTISLSAAGTPDSLHFQSESNGWALAMICREAKYTCPTKNTLALTSKLAELPCQSGQSNPTLSDPQSPEERYKTEPFSPHHTSCKDDRVFCIVDDMDACVAKPFDEYYQEKLAMAW